MLSTGRHQLVPFVVDIYGAMGKTAQEFIPRKATDASPAVQLRDDGERPLRQGSPDRPEADGGHLPGRRHSPRLRCHPWATETN